jgi:hypothetical protein
MLPVPAHWKQAMRWPRKEHAMITAEEKLQHAKDLLAYYQNDSQSMSSSLRNMFLSKSAIIGMVFQTLELMSQQEWEEFAGIKQ